MKVSVVVPAFNEERLLAGREIGSAEQGGRRIVMVVGTTGEPTSEPCIFGEKIVSLTESNQLSASRTVKITFASG